jgi:hypothetical protein
LGLRPSIKYIDISGHFGSGEPEGSPLHMDEGCDVGVELQGVLKKSFNKHIFVFVM